QQHASILFPVSVHISPAPALVMELPELASANDDRSIAKAKRIVGHSQRDLRLLHPCLFPAPFRQAVRVDHGLFDEHTNGIRLRLCARLLPPFNSIRKVIPELRQSLDFQLEIRKSFLCKFKYFSAGTNPPLT